MTGADYQNLIGYYIVSAYGDRGIKVYPQVTLGKSCIGKSRRIDLLVLHEDSGEAYSIECKYQASQGTADEKIPYALQDMAAMPMAGCLVYAGEGFSKGVLHMLESSEQAAYCLPSADSLRSSSATRELDHLLAMHFRWWDIVVGSKTPMTLPE